MSMRILALAGLLAAVNAAANPTQGTVVNGQATIQANGSTLQVTQTTNSAIINWQGFSIGAGETTSFNQPAASSTVLNRVVGGSPSQIIGSLNANGRVYLINTNGVMFANGSQVNTAGFVATTSNVSDATYLADTNAFQSAALAGQGVTFAIDGAFAMAGGDLILDGTTMTMTGLLATTASPTFGGAGPVNIISTGGSLTQPISASTGTLSVVNSGTSSGVVTVGSLTQTNASAVNLSSGSGTVLLSANAGTTLFAGTTSNAGALTVASATGTAGTMTMTGNAPAAGAPSVTLSSGSTPAGSVLAPPQIPPMSAATQSVVAPMAATSANVVLQKREPYH